MNRRAARTSAIGRRVAALRSGRDVGGQRHPRYNVVGGSNRVLLEPDNTATAGVTRPNDGRGVTVNITVMEEREGNALVLLPTDRLYSGNAHSFETLLMEFINNGERQVVVDCSRLDFISSAGMRVLLMASRALKALNGSLAVCAMRTHVEETYRISGLHRVISTETSREAALEAVSGSASGE